MLVGYTRVSKADGSQTTDLQHDALIAAGADRVALPIDAATPALYAQVKGHSIDRALALIRECAARHPGHISTHLIAGLGETEEDILRLAAEIPVRTEVETFPLAEANDVLARLKHSQIRGAAVLQVS